MASLTDQEYVQACLTHCLYGDRPVPTLTGRLDWARVHELASQHKLTGILYRLGTERPDLWPPSLQQSLRKDYAAARLWGELCSEEVRSALSTLRAGGIPAVVLKGWALIPSLYGGDPGLRMCGDMDLLVRPQDAARADDLLRGLGYSAAREPWPGSDRRYGNARVYRRPRTPWPFADPFAVAIHWYLLDTPYFFDKIDSDALVERSEAALVAGVEARELGPEDHLVYACGHLALHHGYEDALHRYYEMAALIRRAGPAFDWEAVALRAAEWRLVVPAQRVLAHLQTLWPGIISASPWEQISALRPGISERLVHGWVVREKENHAARALLAWLTMPRAGARWRYLLENAFPGPDYLQQRYGRAPGGLWPLHYLTRIGLAGKYAMEAVRREILGLAGARRVSGGADTALVSVEE